MKQVIFKKIWMRNFLSVGDDPLEIDFNKGLNIITGVNLDKEDSKNGVGKSSIADALFFVLFGNTIKDLKKEEIVNNINKKNCKVIVSFDVIDEGNKSEYVLMRSIYPTKIQLVKDGVNITKSSIPKTTAQVCRLINSTPEVFENSVVLTVNNIVPFMAQKKVNKRKFIEGILTLGVFSEMLLLVRSEYNDLKKDIESEQKRVEEIEKTLKVYTDQQTKQHQKRDERTAELKGRQKNNTEELTVLRPQIKYGLDKQIEDAKKNIKILSAEETKCRKNLRRIIKMIATKEEKINQIEERIQEIKDLGDKCFTCKRPLDKKDKTTLTNEKKKILQKETDLVNKNKELNRDLKTTEDRKDKCKQAIQKQNDKIHDAKIRINKNANIKDRIKQLKDWNKQLKVDIADLNKREDEFGDLINETQTRLGTLSTQLKSAKTQLNNLDAVKFIVSEEGVKSFIVKKILKLLNGKLTYYLKKMDSAGLCTFNEYFEEHMINDKGQECSYHNFSSGERKRIDLAMLFTFMDIRRLQGDVSLNISFYDEILDTSLDSKGISLFLEIIKERVEKYNEAAYIISHKNEAIKAATSDVIYLEKKNGFTRRVDYVTEI